MSFDRLFPNFAEAWVFGGVVLVDGLAIEYSARTPLGFEGGVCRVIGEFRLFFGIEVIEVAEEFVEAVRCRERLVAVAYVILAELGCGITEAAKQAANGRVKLTHPHGCTWESHFGETRPNAVLAGKECGAASRAGSLAIVVQELHSFFCQPVDVGRVVAHNPITVTTEVRDADVVAEDHQNVWCFCLGHELLAPVLNCQRNASAREDRAAAFRG